MAGRRIDPPRLVLLAAMAPLPLPGLPFRLEDLWLLDPDDPLEAHFARLARRIREAPPPWILAHGGAAAVLVDLAARHLDLRIAGACLLAPRPWQGRRDRLALREVPLPFPVFAPRQPGLRPGLRQAWAVAELPDPAADAPAFLSALALARAARQPRAAARG